MSHLDRALADSTDRVAWAKARSRAIGASDAASFAKVDSIHLYIKSKMHSTFEGNWYTAHGTTREPFILAAAGFTHNTTLFHAPENRLHVATPDGLRLRPDGTLEVAEAKTTVKDLWKIPKGYWRQTQWQMYVMDVDRVEFFWEIHENGNPTTMEPDHQTIFRDEYEINRLTLIADAVLAGIAEADHFGETL